MRSSRDPFPGLSGGALANHSDAPELEARAASAPLGEATAHKTLAGVERALSNFSLFFFTQCRAACHRVTVLAFQYEHRSTGLFAR